MKAAVVIGMCLCLGPAGCAGAAGAPSPRAALARFAASLRANDAASLHAMLPAARRSAERPEALAARLSGDAQERQGLASLIDRTIAEGGPQAEVTLRGSGAITLVEDPEGWRLADPGLGVSLDVSLDGIAGARAAVRALHAALRRRGVGPWVEALSARARGAVESEAAAVMAMTVDPQALEYTLRNGRASFTLADGRTLDVVFEDGAWRVDGLRDAN